MELSDGVLAYHVLKNAITTLTHKLITEQLNKIFGDMLKSLSKQINLKVEPIFHNKNLGPDEEVNFVNRERFQYKGKRSHSTYRGRSGKNIVPLKLGEILKTEPTFRKEPNSEIE